MTETARLNGNGRDPRLDRAATWILQTLMTVALAVGGWYARGTGEKVDAVAAAQAETRTDIAVMRTELVALRAAVQGQEELRRALAAVQLELATIRNEVTTLRRDVDRPR